MVKEKEYWEQFIAGILMVLALYPFTKDWVNEPALNDMRNSFAPLIAGSWLSLLITRTTVAYFGAVFLTLVAIWFGVWNLSRLKKNEEKRAKQILLFLFLL